MKTSAGTLVMLGSVLLAGPALAQSATLNSSGATIAAERTAPRSDRATSVSRGETPVDETASDNSIRVRAPAVTYSYDSSNRDHIDHDAQADQSRLPSRDQAPGSTSGETQQGVLRIINNSESDTAQVEGRNRAGQSETPVNGIGGTGGGRYTFTPTQPSTATPTPISTPGSLGDAEPIFDRWGRIDRLNTAEACTARRGVVLMHEGVQQCRLPSTSRQEGAVRP